MAGRGQQMLGSPCAACKLLRRRCAQGCPFSPYFSPHEPQKFASVHKVFGASNVSKMLREVPEARRADTANSLIYEATMKLRDPIYGCMGEISALQQQLESLQAELIRVRAEILEYKLREEVNNLVTIGSHHISNNNISPSFSSSGIAVAYLTLPPHPPSPPIAAATSASHLIPTAIFTSTPTYNRRSITKKSDVGYINGVNEDVKYFD